jgi:Mg2+-importing ATPase
MRFTETTRLASFWNLSKEDALNKISSSTTGLTSFWQEKGASNAVEALLKMVQIKCLVLRDEKEVELPIEKVVPGDVTLLSAGDVVPAGCLLLESKYLYIDEAAFAGETFPVDKIVL